MPAGSFWVQPAGEVHITAANGENNMAYIEIDSGPYLVHPTKEAFDNAERAVNVDQSNLVWLDASDITWLPTADNEAHVSFLWGERAEGRLNGTLLKLPAGFTGEVQSKASVFHAVVIKGAVRSSQFHNEALRPGSYFGLQGQAMSISSGTGDETIIYIRANDKYNLIHKPKSH